METKLCDSCDAEIGASETTCPKCGTNLAELEETLSAVEKANTVLAKRKAKADAAKPQPAPEAAKTESGLKRLRSLGRAFQKKGA